MAKALGYWMSLPEAAEWLRMNQAYQWKGRDGEPIRTWKRLLRGYLRRNDFRTMAQVEAEERLRAGEAARRRALLEERRRRELEARGPMVSGEAATAILMGSMTLPEALASAKKDNATDNAEKTDERE